MPAREKKKFQQSDDDDDDLLGKGKSFFRAASCHKSKGKLVVQYGVSPQYLQNVKINAPVNESVNKTVDEQ